jgi:hypothetical protein
VLAGGVVDLEAIVLVNFNPRSFGRSVEELLILQKSGVSDSE